MNYDDTSEFDPRDADEDNLYEALKLNSIPVVIVFHQVGCEDPETFVGNVNYKLFNKLKTLHNKYGNVDDEFDHSLAYDENGNLIFESTYNLKRLTQLDNVSGYLIVTGFYC